MKLALELESDRVAPGEQVAGRVIVIEGGPSRSLTLTLSFHERTRDFAVSPHSSGSVVHQGELVSGQTFDFDFTMPAEAPPSVKGEHSELYWEIEVKSDEPGLDNRVGHRLEVVARPTPR